MTETSLTVPALVCHQHETPFYVFSLSASQLAHICFVSRRENHEGYQRFLDAKRAESIKRYIEAGGRLPNNIIVNFHQPEKVLYDVDTKSLVIPYESQSAWIIDGQHRLFGAVLLNQSVLTHHLSQSYEFSAPHGYYIPGEGRINPGDALIREAKARRMAFLCEEVTAAGDPIPNHLVIRVVPL